jgi:hypothetical protein
VGVGGKLLNRSTPIADTTLRGLHPLSIGDSRRIRQLLEHARDNFCVFHRGLNERVDLETAKLERISKGNLIFSASNFQEDSRDQIFLNFSLEGRPYFFATKRMGRFKRGRLTVRISDTIFYSERRDRMRRPPKPREGDPSRLKLTFASDDSAEGQVVDLSPGGLGLLIRRPSIENCGSLVTIEFLDGAQLGKEGRAQLRNWRQVNERPGWIRVGVVQTDAQSIARIRAEYWSDRDTGSRRDSEIENSSTDFDPLIPRVLRFSNGRGEEIVGLVDSWGDLRGATAVVIPNGWGKLKRHCSH